MSGEFCRIASDVVLGRDVRIHSFVNLYGCRVGDETRIGTFVEIQKGASVGARCKISSHTFICEGVRVEDEVFVGHGVMFINDRRPRAPDRRILEARTDNRPTRRIHRLERDHPLRRRDRRARDSRRGRGSN